MERKANVLVRSAVRMLGLAVIAAMITACEKTIVGEEGDTFPRESIGAKIPDNTLRVTTRSGESDATVSYPVQVYVFQGEACVVAQTIGSADEDMSIDLVEGAYTVCAVGGAGNDDYDIPLRDDAKPASALTLRAGKALTDLMAASATATLTDGGTNSVTLLLQRRVMLLQSVTIRQVPTAATAVSVTIGPLYEALAIDGRYSGEGGATTISLTKESDNRTWSATADTYLLPPSGGDVTISITISTAEGPRSFAYTTGELAANHRITIDGTYTEAVGVTLSGSIEGVAWGDDKGITFDFDSSNDTAQSGGNGGQTGGGDDDGEANGGETGDGATDGGANGSGDGGGEGELFGGIPQVGETWRGCYVLAVDDGGGAAVAVTIVAGTEPGGWYDADGSAMEAGVAAALSAVGDGGVVGWRVPVRSEAQLIYEAGPRLGLSGARYLFRDGGGALRAFDATKGSWLLASSAAVVPDGSTLLRPVAVVSVNKE